MSAAISVAPSAQSGMVPPDQALRLLDTTKAALKRAERWGYIPKPTRAGYPTVALIHGFSKYLASDEITLDDAGAMIGTSAQWVRKLIADGYIQRTANGNVTRVGVAQGYALFKEDDQRRISKSEPARQLVAARVREIELRIARMASTLCDTENAIETMQEVVDTYQREFAKMPLRFGSDPDIQRRIAADLDGIYKRVDAVLAKQAQRLRGGALRIVAGEDD